MAVIYFVMCRSARRLVYCAALSFLIGKRVSNFCPDCGRGQKIATAGVWNALAGKKVVEKSGEQWQGNMAPGVVLVTVSPPSPMIALSEIREKTITIVIVVFSWRLSKPHRKSSGSFRFRFYVRLHEVKSGKGNRKCNRSLHPVHANAFEKTSPTLFGVQRPYHGRHTGWRSWQSPSILVTTTATSAAAIAISTTAQVVNCGILAIDYTQGLHAPTSYFNRIGDTLGNQTRKGSTLHAFCCFQVAARDALNLRKINL